MVRPTCPVVRIIVWPTQSTAGDEGRPPFLPGILPTASCTPAVAQSTPCKHVTSCYCAARCTPAAALATSYTYHACTSLTGLTFGRFPHTAHAPATAQREDWMTVPMARTKPAEEAATPEEKVCALLRPGWGLRAPCRHGFLGVTHRCIGLVHWCQPTLHGVTVGRAPSNVRGASTVEYGMSLTLV